ncbi:MAG: Putative type II secretion system protein E [Candidatus Erwinia impunctatus]|nr:Putative type II secretion system protein E [Culicoides impunctatus]
MNGATLETLTDLCLQYRAIVLSFSPQRLQIATENPPNTEMMAALRFVTPARIDIERWSSARLQQYARQHKIPWLAELADVNEAGATAQVDALLQLALQRHASDIHLEPQTDALRLRLRIDGVLQVITLNSQHSPAALISRLKILAGLDIAERRLPQDGQFTIPIQGESTSFRLSTLPTLFGEKAVIRLLESHHQAVSLDKLGMSTRALTRFRQALALPQGLILVTGPTGSGKTFTLYSRLNWLNSPERNICSVEDPIEIPLNGINQTQTHAKTGLGFSRVLRALLRQDPDVIMLGEIRDTETAEITIQAAQTGHLVLSTLHTNSTTETITRLRQMGVASYLLASALKLVISQRLVRRLCEHCRQQAEAIAHFPPSLWPGTVQNWQAAGCEHCHAGYHGRLALFELLYITPAIQNAIMMEQDAETIGQLASKQGAPTLFAEGLRLVNRGETTLAELYRVIGLPHV